jgi:hypothetical protein
VLAFSLAVNLCHGEPMLFSFARPLIFLRWCLQMRMTPLHMAVDGGHLEVVRLLLAAGACVAASDQAVRYRALYCGVYFLQL